MNKKFREENPLLFYGVIFIICILIYGKIAINQTHDIEMPPESNSEIVSDEEYQEIPESEEVVIEKQEQDAIKDLKDKAEPTQDDKAFNRMANSWQRHAEINPRGGLKKDFVYKNDVPFGREATINYDDFLKKYHIHFDDENGDEVHFVLLEGNFEFNNDSTENNNYSLWSFKYNGSIYRLEDKISPF